MKTCFDKLTFFGVQNKKPFRQIYKIEHIADSDDLCEKDHLTNGLCIWLRGYNMSLHAKILADCDL